MQPKLSQNQFQKMALSPQMRIFLRLLHLPITELRQAVDQTLEENPMLEEAADSQQIEETEMPPAPSKKERNDDEEDSEAFPLPPETSVPLDFLRTPPDFSKRSREDLQKIRDFQENLLTSPESLFDFLEWQLSFVELSKEERKIAEQIVGNINQDGYLTASLEDIAKASDTDISKVEPVLKKIQQLDPPGVAARDLKEALIIQLGRKGPEGGLARAIVKEHLDLIAKRDWKMLARIYNRSENEIQTAAAIISKLEPKPGRSFYSEEAIAVVPDATITLKEGSSNDLEIRINNDQMPRIRISREYRGLLRDAKTDPAAKDFLKTRLASGTDFIKALELRNSTLRSITEEIVRAQPLFFTRGFSHLRPLKLKEIAERLGLHESTISRAIHGKYLSTPQGTVPYKSFFSQRIETRDGAGESQKSIMEKIKALVDKENPKKPLSDQEIVKVLKAEGIQIARRTVAKYRELLKILPTHLRRRK